MKFLCTFVLLLLLLHRNVNSQLSEKQLQSAGKMMRNVCQPKTKVTNELIDGMHRGEFVKDQTLMCYVECVTKIAKMIKDGKFDYDSVMTQIKNLPLERQQSSTEAANKCKDLSGTAAEKCENGFEIYKCIYNSNPAEFYLP